MSTADEHPVDRPLDRTVAGALIGRGDCGEDDITSANLEQMADTLDARPLTDDDRRELAGMLRWLASYLREVELSSSHPSSTPAPQRRG